MLQFRRWSITLLGLIVIIAGLGFIKFSQIQAAIAFGESFPETNETVQASTTEWTSWQANINLVGEIKAPQIVQIRNELEGVITKIGFSSGGSVKQGDVIVQLNVETELAQLEAIEAEIALAKLDVKRLTDLLDVRASSKEQLDRAKAQLAISQARAKSLRATINKKTILAPFDGRVGIHDWQVGSYLTANTLLTQIIGKTDSIFVDFNVPQAYANITVGQNVTIKLEGKLSPGLSASVVAINQQLNNSSRTLAVRAKVSNSDGLLKPGIVVSVMLPTGADLAVIALPNEAIRFDTFGTYVYILRLDEKGNYRASRQAVKVIERQANTSFITEGLESGQTVATIGSAKLQPNMLTFIAE